MKVVYNVFLNPCLLCPINIGSGVRFSQKINGSVGHKSKRFGYLECLGSFYRLLILNTDIFGFVPGIIFCHI